MTSAPVPLAEQIEAVQRALKLIRNIETPFTVRDKESLDAAAATLQQHERALAALREARMYMSKRDVRLVAQHTGIDVDVILGYTK